MDLYQRYLQSSIHFLKFRPRSEKEIRDNLFKKKAPPEIIEQVIHWLKEQRFLNDEEFARMWIESRVKYKQKSKRVLELELKQKGISKDIILAVMDRSEVTTQNDLDLAKQIVEKKIQRYKNASKQEIYQKLGGLLGRRGFDFDVIKKAIDTVLEGDHS